MVGLATALAVTCAFLLGRTGFAALGVALVVSAVVYRESLLRFLRLGWGGVKRHPLAMLGVALMVPIGVVGIEAGMVGLSFQQDWLRYMELEIEPRSAAVAAFDGREDVGSIDYNLIPDTKVLALYGQGLRRGYALSWAIPASLTRGAGLHPLARSSFVNSIAWYSWINPLEYTAFKAFCTFGAITALLFLLMLGGDWVRLIATLELRHLAPKVEPSSRMSLELPRV